MDRYDERNSTLGAQRIERSMTRLDHDITRVKAMSISVIRIRDRIVDHARVLGYFEPPPQNPATSAPTPVVTTLTDALAELDREIDHLSGALNLFD